MVKAIAMLGVSALMCLQFSCAAGSTSVSRVTQTPLATPEVAVVRTQNVVLVAWKPVDDADGYFVYRQSHDSPEKILLGIGPKDASGYIDRHPLQSARYTVQAFKASEPSEPQQTKQAQKSPAPPQSSDGNALTAL